MADKKTEDKPKKASKKAEGGDKLKGDDKPADKEKKGDGKEEDLTNPDVVTKYRLAGDIANAALAFVVKAVTAADAIGKKVVDLCDAGDKFIADETGKIYNAKTKDGNKVEKGIAFPTSISVNHIVGHFSPLAGDALVLKAGDYVKIDLGVHIDGYCAVVATTVVLPGGAAPAAAPAAGAPAAPAPAADAKAPITGKAAAVLTAANTAAELAVRLLKPGNTNTQITNAISAVAAAYKVNAVQGVLSHSVKRFVIDGEKVIINRADPEQVVEECKFETNEVYAIDIVMSTGEGKPKESEMRTTIFKRALETHYSLRVSYSRRLLADIDERFPTFPFTLRALDEKTAKIGIADMVKHDLVHSYPVLVEKEGEFVAHVKFTAALLPSGTVRIAHSGLDMSRVQCPADLKLTDESLVKTLTETVKKAGAKNRKKKPAAAAPAGGAAAPAAAAPAAGAAAPAAKK